MLSKESALNDLDCVDRLLAMIAPILKDPPNEDGGDGDAAMQVLQTRVDGVREGAPCALRGIWVCAVMLYSRSLPLLERLVCLFIGGGGRDGVASLHRSGRWQGHR